MTDHLTHALTSTKSSLFRAWRIFRIGLSVAAYASLALVIVGGWQLSHGKIVKFDGIAHAELPFGDPQQALITQLPADQTLPPQALQALPEAHVTHASYRLGDVPAAKPKVQ